MGKRRRRMTGRKRICASLITAAVVATGTASQAADIAVIAGSAQDAFFNRVKKASTTQRLSSRPMAAK
jgi:hypothetical protein